MPLRVSNRSQISTVNSTWPPHALSCVHRLIREDSVITIEQVNTLCTSRDADWKYRVNMTNVRSLASLLPSSRCNSCNSTSSTLVPCSRVVALSSAPELARHRDRVDAIAELLRFSEFEHLECVFQTKSAVSLIFTTYSYFPLYSDNRCTRVFCRTRIRPPLYSYSS